jgi:hypothetical protein
MQQALRWGALHSPKGTALPAPSRRQDVRVMAQAVKQSGSELGIIEDLHPFTERSGWS